MTELPDIYLSLDKILEDPKAARLYLQGILRAGNVDLAITVIQSIVNAEKQKSSYRIEALEARVDEIEKHLQQLDIDCQEISVAQFYKDLALLGYKMVLSSLSNTTGDNE